MASLISQNALPKDPSKKKKKKTNKNDIVLVQEGKEGFEYANQLDLGTLKAQKRKRGRMEKDDAAEIEQEKEMKKLENVLFGSLYFPVEFGKDDDDKEEALAEADNSSALFFTDKSANSALSVYEEDMESGEENADGVENQQRKPLWVDEEEEKTIINIAKVNKLRKLRKEEGESVISGSAYVSRLRAKHTKMNPGTEWARPEARAYNSSDDEDSDKESTVMLASGYEQDVNDILRTNGELVLNLGRKLLPGRLEYSRLMDANVNEPSTVA